jgi:tetratricopeptide (TPR) repeat protein
MLVTSEDVSAQITVEQLLSNSIEQIGPKHADVSNAIEAFSKGDFLKSRELLDSAVTKDPMLPPPGVMLAQMLYIAKQPALAQAELERTVKEHADDPEAYLFLGEIAFQNRRFTDAELAFSRATQLVGKYTANPFRKNTMLKRAYSGLAGVAEVREDWDRAGKFLSPILKANPADANNTVRMARSLFKQDKAKEAYQLLIQQWKEDKTVRRPEIVMGLMYQEAGDKTNAASLMKSAAAKDTDGIDTQLSVARWAMEAGDLELAQACSSRALSISPDSVDAKLVSGLVARYQKDYAKAREALEAAHLQSPSNLAAILQLAVVLVEEPGSEKTALEYAQMAQRVYSDLGDSAGREAAVTLAWVLYRTGRQNEALRLLQQALTGGSVSAESSFFAARILYQNNREVAKKLLESALKNERVFPARGDAEKLLASLSG